MNIDMAVGRLLEFRQDWCVHISRVRIPQVHLSPTSDVKNQQEFGTRMNNRAFCFSKTIGLPGDK